MWLSNAQWCTVHTVKSMFSNLVIPGNERDWHRCTWPVSCDSEGGRCIHMQLTWCQKPRRLNRRQEWCTVGRCHKTAHEQLQIFVIKGSVPSVVIFSLFAIQAMISLPVWKNNSRNTEAVHFSTLISFCSSILFYSKNFQ